MIEIKDVMKSFENKNVLNQMSQFPQEVFLV